MDTCLHPWSTVRPVGCTPITLYSTSCIYSKLLCNCQETSAVVPLVVPPSRVVKPIRLYPLYCTLYLCTLTSQHVQVLVALSFAFVSNVFVSFLQCALHWLQLSRCFSLTTSLRNLPTFYFVLVPDRRSRIIPEVVLVRRWTVGVLGIWRGEGLGEGWGKGGQFTSNLSPRWTIPVTARRVPSK